jgi:hypothetical protein
VEIMMVRKTRSNGRWLDSLMWLGLAGILAALLVPPPRKHVAANAGPRLAERRSSPEQNAKSSTDVLTSPKEMLLPPSMRR